MFKEILGKIATTVIEHQPVIATVVLVGSVIATGIVIYKESPKIHKAFEERKEEIKDIKESDAMTEEEKEDEIDKVDKKTFKKVLPSGAKIMACAVATGLSIAAFSFTSAAFSASAIGAEKFANMKLNAYEKAVDEQAPEKKDDIKKEVQKTVKEYMAKDRPVAENSAEVLRNNRGSKVRITDEFGNSWKGYYADCVNSKNIINDLINSGDDVEVNTFYEGIPGCRRTGYGRIAMFAAYKGQITLKPEAVLNQNTGELEEILLFYGVKPVVEDKAYVYSEKEAEADKDFRESRW